MIIQRGYKYELKDAGHKMDLLVRTAGCCRYVWNKTLAEQKERLNRGERVVDREQMNAELPKWKQEFSFLKEVASQALQQTQKDLSRAFKDFFKKEKGFPNFKRKHKSDSFRFPQGVKIDNSRIYLPKLGWFKFRKSKEIEGAIKNVTVSKQNDKWYVSIQTQIEVAEPVHPSNTVVGIDLGVVRFATMSDGTVIEPRNCYRTRESKLIAEQRKLARKIKFSNNWKKQKKKVGKIHRKIANGRRDFIHKTTSEIAKNHGVIVLEDLKITNMMKSARGSIEEPATNVAAKAGLSKSIADQGWYEFKRQLLYRQRWLGGKVILVTAVNTSRRCSQCSHVDVENRKSQALFRCQSCSYSDKADLNAAKNILAAGQAVIACADISQVAA